jgi:hypothetical protein
MRRRAIPFLLALAGVVACSFPGVTYTSGSDGATGDDGGGIDGTVGADGSTESGSGTDASTEGGDDASVDSPGLADVINEFVFEAAPDAPACDMDEDMDPAKGATCGGTDCDDHDPRAFFGEPDFLTYAPTPVTMGDWNCDGVVTLEYTTGFNCGAINLGQCGTATGFTDSPGCGQTSPNFITCKKNVAGLLCVVDTTKSWTQGCK